MAARFVVCLTTAGSLSDGEKIARHLVKKRLAACIQLLPGVVSFYHWKGKFCRDKEVVLLMKTTSHSVRSLEKELLKIHPYDLPEFVVLPISGGSRRYLQWIMQSTTE